MKKQRTLYKVKEQDKTPEKQLKTSQLPSALLFLLFLWVVIFPGNCKQWDNKGMGERRQWQSTTSSQNLEMLMGK